MSTRPAAVLLRAAIWPAVLSLTAGATLLGAAGVALGPAAIGSVALGPAATLLAAAAAFTLDEPSAAIVDVTPTSRIRRTAARAYALSVPLLAGVGLASAIHTRDAALSTTELAAAVVGNVLLGFAAACAARRSSAEPGILVATTITVTFVAASLIPPIARRVQLFPTSPTASVSSTTWWTLIIVAGILTIAAATHPADTAPRLRSTVRKGHRAGSGGHDSGGER